MNFSGTKMSQSKRIAGVLRQAILDGKCISGEKLKSIRAMAEEFGVGRQIILSAFEILTREGLLIMRPSSGTFVNPDFVMPKNNYRIGFYSHRGSIKSNHAGEVFEQCAQYAEKRHCDLLMRSYHPDIEEEKLFDGIDGLIVTGEVDDDLVKVLNAAGKPFVIVGTFELTTPANQILWDFDREFDALFMLALKYFNVRSVGMLSGWEHFYANRMTVRSFKRNVKKYGLEFENFCNVTQNVQDGFQGLMTMSDNCTRELPDMIYMSSNHYVGANEFFYRHPEVKKPVLVTIVRSSLIPAAFAGNAIIGSNMENSAREGMELLFELLENRAKNYQVRFADMSKRRYRIFRNGELPQDVCVNGVSL